MNKKLLQQSGFFSLSFLLSVVLTFNNIAAQEIAQVSMLKKEIYPTKPINRTIIGQVKDDNDEALIGVTILVKENPTIGTTTDERGNFTLSIPTDAKTLVFSYTGYLNKEVEIGVLPVFQVQLSADNKILKEVVVVGYG